MNPTMIKQLVLKDWYFNRGVIAITMVTGLAALGGVFFGGEVGFNVGVLALIIVLMILGAYLVIGTVIYERKEQTLPFIMSLPISVVEYTTAKILANLLIYLVPWLALVVGGFVVILTQGELPNGILPLFVLVMIELFAAYCVVLAVTIISESEGWAIIFIIATQLFFQYFVWTVPNLPGLAENFESKIAIWGRDFGWILFIEVLVIVFTMGLTFLLQAKKRDFL